MIRPGSSRSNHGIDNEAPIKPLAARGAARAAGTPRREQRVRLVQHQVLGCAGLPRPAAAWASSALRSRLSRVLYGEDVHPVHGNL